MRDDGNEKTDSSSYGNETAWRRMWRMSELWDGRVANGIRQAKHGFCLIGSWLISKHSSLIANTMRAINSPSEAKGEG